MKSRSHPRFHARAPLPHSRLPIPFPQAISINVGKSLAASSSTTVITTVSVAFLATIYRLGGTTVTSASIRRMVQASAAPLVGSSHPSPRQPATQVLGCKDCTLAIASALAAGLCAIVPLQNCR